MSRESDGPDVHLNLNVRGMRPSATVAINERSDALRAAGREVLKLGLGQSPFPVPAPVVQALRDHAAEKDYLPVVGLPTLREAVAAYHARRDGVDRGAAQVLVGPGSKELLFLLQLCYYGDLVVPSPSWVSYVPQARIIGRRIQSLPTTPEDGWMLRPQALDALCREDPTRPRVLILNYPSNPTGRTFAPAALEGLAEVARRYRVVVLSDEIYGELHHSGAHASIARYYPEGTIISAGLSKWCGAGGWRLGTFLFPPQLRWLLDAMAAVASETFTSTSAPIQYAAVTAFRGGPEIDDYLARSRRVLAALGPWCAARLRAGGARCPEPEGGFYLFADLSGAHGAAEIGDSRILCERILEDTGVAILPGADFGRPAAELTARLAYVDFDGGAALAAAAPGTVLDERWLRRWCPGVTRAMDRLTGWAAERQG
jgi:aspartate aminotransferase